MRWWDYSGRRYNLRGRVCLRNSALFGLACVVLCHLLAPRVMIDTIYVLRVGLGIPLAMVLTVVYAADMIVSVRSAVQIGNRLAKLHAIHDELKEKLEELKEMNQQAREMQKARLEEFVYTARQRAAEKGEGAAAELQERIEQLKAEQQRTKEAHQRLLRAAEAEAQNRLRQLYDKSGYFERRLMRSFPALHEQRHAEALAKLREYLDDRRKGNSGFYKRTKK